jgi:hypothetical protein
MMKTVKEHNIEADYTAEIKVEVIARAADILVDVAPFHLGEELCGFMATYLRRREWRRLPRRPPLRLRPAINPEASG